MPFLFTMPASSFVVIMTLAFDTALNHLETILCLDFFPLIFLLSKVSFDVLVSPVRKTIKHVVHVS